MYPLSGLTSRDGGVDNDGLLAERAETDLIYLPALGTPLSKRIEPSLHPLPLSVHPPSARRCTHHWLSTSPTSHSARLPITDGPTNLFGRGFGLHCSFVCPLHWWGKNLNVKTSPYIRHTSSDITTLVDALVSRGAIIWLASASEAVTTALRSTHSHTYRSRVRLRLFTARPRQI